MAFYFPEPYKDEILYSIIARYHYYVGNKNTKLSLMELFGSETLVPTVDLTSNLKKFCRLIGNSSIYNAEYFINKHTNLPFYFPFLELNNRAGIRESMINRDGKGIYTKIGIVAGGGCSKSGLYYCPKCVLEDIGNVGEPYFHRVHQVPGVIVCPIHFCLVKKYLITKNDIGRINFIRLDLRYIDNNIIYLEDPIINNNLINIAQCADYILNNDLSKFNQLSIVKKYKLLLDEKGLLTPKKRVKQNKLTQLFKDYFTEELLEMLQSNINNTESNWLRMLTRKPKHTVNPVRHIIFILFLCGDIDAFFVEDNKKNYPFGKAPWPCLNPASDHYKELVIDKCKITSDYKTRQPVATFACKCGFIYSKKVTCKETNDIYKIGRIKNYGKVWEEKLLQLVDDRQYSTREIGRIMKCDSKTIVKHSRRLGIGEIINSKMKIIESKHNINSSNYGERYSKDILQLISQYPGYTRSQIRKALKKQYAWFYRNNREWLESNLPIVSKQKDKKKTPNLRVDWNKRDDETYIRIKSTYENLFNDEKQVRITKSIIGNKLGISALLEHYLEKLPKTQKYLSEITETVEDFQIRRVNIICKLMIEENIELKKWKIVRGAGLKPSCSSKVTQKINDYLQ
ncbi:MAG: hypothetical protein ACI8WT_001376 [Clostridium sp.]|jgi:hypothetical protein